MSWCPRCQKSVQAHVVETQYEKNLVRNRHCPECFLVLFSESQSIKDENGNPRYYDTEEVLSE